MERGEEGMNTQPFQWHETGGRRRKYDGSRTAEEREKKKQHSVIMDGWKEKKKKWAK